MIGTGHGKILFRGPHKFFDVLSGLFCVTTETEVEPIPCDQNGSLVPVRYAPSLSAFRHPGASLGYSRALLRRLFSVLALFWLHKLLSCIRLVLQ